MWLGISWVYFSFRWQPEGLHYGTVYLYTATFEQKIMVLKETP